MPALLAGLAYLAPILVAAAGAAALAYLVGVGIGLLVGEDHEDARRRNQARPATWRDRL